MKLYLPCILFIICSTISGMLWCQDGKKLLPVNSLFDVKKDSLAVKDSSADKRIIKKDTVAKHNPRIATRRSALIPGWGQAYNKEYWKIPIVYGIIAIPTVLYFYNNSYYKKTKFAFEARFKEANGDSSDVKLIDDQLKNLSITSLQSYRNAFRRDKDYSILWFLLAWGLQVADATVFGHLKQFDVSDDLTMSLSPQFNPYTRTPGLGISLNLKNASQKQVSSR